MKRFRRFFLIVTALWMCAAPTLVSAQKVDLGPTFYTRQGIDTYDASGTDLCTTENGLNLSIEQKIAQTMIVGFDASAKESMGASISKFNLGGIYINGKPDASMNKEFFSGLSKPLATDLIVAADDEGGQIIRFQKNAFSFSLPSAKTMGTWDDSKIESETQTLATNLKNQGVNMVLAPVLDLDSGNTNNAISKYDRAFSSDPAIVSAKAGAFAHTMGTAGLGTSLKHFPGLARTTENTDTTYQTINADIGDLANDVKPFKDLASTKNTTLMLGNMVLSGWGTSPVSLNESAVQYIRSTLGFQGPIVTDDIGVFGKYSSNPIPLKDAIVRAYNAGVSMPLFGYPGDTEMQAIIDEVKAKVMEDKIDSALNLAVAYKTSLGLRTTGPSTPGGDEPPPPSGDNMGDIYNYGINQLGLQPYQSAGLAGNIQRESGGNPTAVNPTSGAYGIVQWLGGRLSALKAKPGYDTVPVQLDFMKEELEGSYKTTVYDPLKASKDIQEATGIVLYKYEIPCFPGTPECTVEFAARLAFAQELLNKYGNGAPSGGGSGCTTGGSGTRGAIDTDATQCDIRTTFNQVIKTKYTGSEVDEPNPTIRTCNVPTLGNAEVNAGVSGLFADLGEAATADGVTLTGSGFRYEDSCGGVVGDPFCAHPGKSPHQIGVAIDFHIPNGTSSRYIQSCEERATANGDPMYDWLRANAYSTATVKQFARETWHWDLTLKAGLRCE